MTLGIECIVAALGGAAGITQHRLRGGRAGSDFRSYRSSRESTSATTDAGATSSGAMLEPSPPRAILTSRIRHHVRTWRP